jgi:8-oxo-dGTP pyrophosphatase MutT (NUDIX family)
VAEIALVTAYNAEGQLLFGKRRDTGNWTLPGGHLEEGEEPRAGAARELLEETGLTPKSLSFLKSYTTSAGHNIHAFSAYVVGTPHSKNDPDDEVEEWKFFDVTEGLPPKVDRHLQGPPDKKDNLVRQLYEPEEVKKTEAKCAKCSKPATVKAIWAEGMAYQPSCDDHKEFFKRKFGDEFCNFRPINKAEDEVGRLLDHPDPVERRLALRLGSVGPAHVRHAMLDPTPLVHEAALDHPHFCDVDGMELLRAPYDHSGAYPLTQQLSFLRRPNVTPEQLGHVIASAPMSPGNVKDALFDVVCSHPNLSADNIADAYSGYACSQSQRLALLQHPNAPAHVLQHALDWGAKSGSPEALAAAHAAAPHKNLPIASRDAFVRAVGAGAPQHVHDLAAHVLRTGHVSPDVGQHLFLQNVLKQDSPHDALLGAYLEGPTATNADVTRALGMGGRHLLLGAASSKALLPHQFDDVVSQIHGSGDHEAMERIMDNPFFGNRHLQCMLSTPMSKSDSHDPGAARAMDPIEAAGWVSRMKHAFSKAPWNQGQPKWETLHGALTSGAPEAFDHIREMLNPEARLARHRAKTDADQAEDERKTYEAQAVELGDHAHKPDHGQRAAAGGRDVWMYHGTSSKLVPKLLTEGIPGAALAARATGDDSAETDAGRAAHAHGGAPVTLRVKHPFDKLRATGHGRYETDHVPAESIMEANGERVPKNQVAKSEALMESISREPIVQAMLGCPLAERPPFRAAKFLSGGPEAAPDALRRALYQAGGNQEAAALRAYGFPVNDKTIASLRGVMSMADVKKTELSGETPPGHAVTAAHAEGQDVADAVKRAFAHRFVLPISLDGKHSKGSLLAHDKETNATWLLKTGSGGAGAAAGADEDPSNPNAREAAWYHIAKTWGVEAHYPRAELLMVDGREYAALHLLPWSYRPLEKLREQDPGVAPRVLAPYFRDGRVHQWAAMDFIFGNPDSHGENVMAEDENEQRPNERRRQSIAVGHRIEQRTTPPDVQLIDHGSAFAGPEFDPANDQNSFVPYVLRAWAPHDAFHSMSVAEKLRVMPRVDPRTAAGLKTWLAGLDGTTAARIAESYGINPKPSLDRLARLQTACAVEPADAAINRLWVTT